MTPCMALQISNKISQDHHACVLCRQQLPSKKAAQRLKHGQVLRVIQPSGITTQQRPLQRLHPRTVQSNYNLRWRERKMSHRPGLNPMLAMLRHGACGPILPAWFPGGALFTHCFNNQVCGLFICLSVHDVHLLLNIRGVLHGHPLRLSHWASIVRDGSGDEAVKALLL